MLSPPAITADSNACRHPTIEVINPVAPDRISRGSPGQRQIGIDSAIYVPFFIASNSQ
jgi:hypothetical protein